MKNGFWLILLSVKALAFDFYPTNNLGKTIEHQYYKLSYVEKYELAEWTAHQLTIESIKGPQSRTDNFREDPKIPTGSATTSDYKGSGFDRGHLVPAGDMKLNYTSMSETFFMSNMAPQTALMNRGVWREIETKVRRWAESSKKLYIITGPILNGMDRTIGNNNVAVPLYFYKIIYDANQNKMIAFLVPNFEPNPNMEEYVVDVNYLESITQIDFFSQLADNIEEELESSSDFWQWP